MKVLFVDHAYHNSTKSSFFMVELLSKHFDIDVLLINPHEENLDRKINNLKLIQYDFIILWQIDWLATYFLHLGFKVVVIPMFDGSSTLDSIHWRVARDALFINFSLSLHNIITDAGCESIYVRYFPQKTHKNTRTAKRSLKKKPTAFFWERRPDTMLNTGEICRLLGSSISHLHVHQAPDPGLSPSGVPENLPFTVSTSTWFACGEQYLDCVCEHDIYVAPRYSEGIGMGFLEAMSLGRVVLAHDAPTHNEYIKNNHNGIIFNAFRKDILEKTPQEIIEIGKNAASDSDELFRSWDCFYKNIIAKKIISYLNQKSDKKNIIKKSKFSPQLILKNVSSAHLNLKLYYRFLKDIEESLLLDCGAESIMPEISNLELCGNYVIAKELLIEKINSYGGDSIYGLFLEAIESRWALKKHN